MFKTRHIFEITAIARFFHAVMVVIFTIIAVVYGAAWLYCFILASWAVSIVTIALVLDGKVFMYGDFVGHHVSAHNYFGGYLVGERSAIRDVVKRSVFGFMSLYIAAYILCDERGYVFPSSKNKQEVVLKKLKGTDTNLILRRL